MALEAYRAYGEVTDFKNFGGDPMPDYENLPEKIQKAWRTAAAKVASFVETYYSDLLKQYVSLQKEYNQLRQENNNLRAALKDAMEGKNEA